jgi:two-component system chemotaxis response regulator CheB
LAAIFVMMHLGKQSMPEIIVQQIEKVTRFTCSIPANGEEIRGIIHKNKGPHENRWRPFIDVLFRSAKMVILLWMIRSKRKFVQMTVPVLFRF